MCSLKSEPDTYDTLSSTVKWSSRKRESGTGRCTARPAFGSWSVELGFDLTQAVASIPWDNPRWHREICQPVARPRVASPLPTHQ